MRNNNRTKFIFIIDIGFNFGFPKRYFISSFKSIFSKLTQYNFEGWAVLEWECCLKHPEEGAKEGAAFIKEHIINVTDKAFDDFAHAGIDQSTNRRLLGIE